MFIESKISYSLRMIPNASSLMKQNNHDSKEELNQVKLKNGTCYQLPKLNEARRLLIEKQKVDTASIESSLGSINKQLRSNKIYKQFRNKLNWCASKKNSNRTDPRYSVNDTVRILDSKRKRIT
jgi:hypothetical protein